MKEDITIIKGLDLNYVRSKFPSLYHDFVFMDNAGGSQILAPVISEIEYFFKNYYVQLGASYSVSANAGSVLEEVHKRLAQWINANRKEEIIIGPSTTMLLRILSICLAREWKEGDEIIVTNSDHEANVSCWMDLKKMGIKIKIWKIHPESLQLDLNVLDSLITTRTRMVAMVHTSNILGTINPIRKVADLVHDRNALLCVDGVAFAPHRRIDVQDFDADFYVFSTYKTYGPHQAILYGKYDLLLPLEGLNHYFIGKEEVPYKFQPGNFNFELSYSLRAIPAYFRSIGSHHSNNRSDTEECLQTAYQLIAKHEQLLSQKMIRYLATKPEIKIIGTSDADMGKRVPTISFVHEKLISSDIVTKTDPFNIGIRFGDFYAKKLIQDLGLVNQDGVVRVSMVHYNTLAEVDRLIEAFETIF